VLKVKVGVANDKANMQALRDVAPSKAVRADANEGWKTKEHALEMIECWPRMPHPICRATYAGGDLGQRVGLAQAAVPPADFRGRILSRGQGSRARGGMFHGVNVKLVKTGGISGGFEALQAARKAGLKTMIGCMIETSILINAAAHLAELCDYLDVDGNILCTNDPYIGVRMRTACYPLLPRRRSLGLRGKREGRS